MSCFGQVHLALDFQIEQDLEGHLTSLSIKYLFEAAGDGLGVLGQALCRGDQRVSLTPPELIQVVRGEGAGDPGAEAAVCLLAGG